MSTQKKKQLILTLLLALALFSKQSPAYCAWETVKAKTLDYSEEQQASELYEYEFDEDLPNYNSNQNISNFLSEKFKNFIKNKKENKKETTQLEQELLQDELIQDNIVNEQQEQKKETLTTQNEAKLQQKEIVKDKNKFQINADKITYDDENGEVIAKGKVEIIAKAQDVTLKADEAILNRETQTIKLHNNVKIIKNGTEMKGEYLLVNLNEENILMDNPTYEAFSFQIKAQEGYLIANDIQMLNGTIKSTKEVEYPFITRGFMRLNSIDREFAGLEENHNKKNKKNTQIQTQSDDTKKQRYRIDTKEIVLTSYKDHNSIEMKKANIYYNDHKIIRNSDIEIISDKKIQTFETSTPEVGNLRNFGTYFGYGYVQKLPKGQTLKIMPVLAYSDSNLGVGAILRHRSPNSILEGGWNSAGENLVVRGKYRFSNPLTLTYGRNAYMPEGFMGARRSGYAAQLHFAKSYAVRDLDLRFNHGIYAGIFSDYQKHDQEDAYSTTRFRYIAEIRKRIATYYNEEQDFTVSLNTLAQGAATVYGSGETAGVVRVGPYVSTKFKRWESSIGYIMSGIHGDSPFVFDKYRYGKSSIIVNEKFNFTDNFSLGFRTFISPLKDNYEEDLLTECRFYAIVGPKDLKVALSYDFVRDLARMDFMFLIGTKSSKIDFEKLTTKNLDGSEEKFDFYKGSKPIKIVKPENENI